MEQKNEIAQQLKTMNIVYGALVASQLVVGGIFYFLLTSGNWSAPDYSMAVVFQTVAMFFVPLSMAAGYFVFKSLIKQVNPALSLYEKLQKYFSFVIVRAALFEAPFLFLCVIALVTGVVLFLYMTPVILFVFLLLRPTPQGIAADLELNNADRKKLGL